jgi:ABC-2 type transport system permease protein
MNSNGVVSLDVLVRIKVRSVWNRLRQGVDEAPLRLFATVIFAAVVWVGMYFLFRLIFDALRRTPLEATVAMPLILNYFFLSLLIMLTFSNAILMHGALFSQEEPAYLLACPVRVLDIVSLKYVEGLLLSSWSLILLGLPLIAALARQAEDPVSWVLFLAFFLAFIPIPGGLGLILAWAAGRLFPAKAVRATALLAGVAFLLALIWGIRSLKIVEAASQVWLRSFMARMSFVEAVFLPNQWVSAGIDHALHRQFGESALYLGVTLANAFFVSWLAVQVVTRGFSGAFDRASVGRGELRRAAVAASGGWAGCLFAYLPAPLRLVAAKDLRVFFRDSVQGSQLLILFGLLGLYLANLPNLRLHLGGAGWVLLMPFLNLCAVSLILATFACRFVYPLPSLEGRHLWLVSLLPLPLGRILLAKFAFAMTVTLILALGAMGLALPILDMDRSWSLLHLLVTAAICFGLCGLAVGFGACFPMLDEPNVARITSGVGGTANLLASLTLVTAVLLLVGLATWRQKELRIGEAPDLVALALYAGAIGVAVLAGTVALAVGMRRFQNIEA